MKLCRGHEASQGEASQGLVKLRRGQAWFSVFDELEWCNRFAKLTSTLMPRLPRLEYANAIYHVITRGDGRRQLFHDLGHYDRITRGLKDEVSRSSWKVRNRTSEPVGFWA